MYNCCVGFDVNEYHSPWLSVSVNFALFLVFNEYSSWAGTFLNSNLNKFHSNSIWWWLVTGANEEKEVGFSAFPGRQEKVPLFFSLSKFNSVMLTRSREIIMQSPESKKSAFGLISDKEKYSKYVESNQKEEVIKMTSRYKWIWKSQERIKEKKKIVGLSWEIMGSNWSEMGCDRDA